MKRRIFIAFLAFCILFSGAARAAERFFFDGKWELLEVGITLLLNGRAVDTDIPPIIINDRTYAPARALFEKMGAEVLWDEGSRAVTVSGDGFKVVLTIDSRIARVNGRTVSMDTPPKIIADANVIGRTMLPVRFVSESLGFTVGWNEGKRIVSIDSAISSATPMPTPAAAPAVKKITNRAEGGADIVEIEVSKAAAPSIAKYKDPERLVIDFEGFTLLPSSAQTGKAGVNIKNVRYAYHEGKYTRVVIDLNNEVDYKIAEAGGLYTITLTGAALQNITYKNAGSPSLSVKTKGAITEVSAADDSFVFSAADKDLGKGILNIGDLYIESIELRPKGSETLIIVSTRAKLGYKISEKAGEKIISFEGHALAPVSLSLIGGAKGKKVVLDAGHGGSDPGTVVKNEHGISDIYEKDLNLDITLKTAELLKKAGAQVILTRDGDVYPSLEERVSLANSREADIFVSIHNNSFTNPDAQGHIVFCYIPPPASPAPEGLGELEPKGDEPEPKGDEPAAKKDEGGVTSRRLAEHVLKEMTASMGTTSRGVQDGTRYYVVRSTKMPAVLVECAFLTNPGELEMMMTDEFREKTARGIAKGIISALNEGFGS